MITTSQDWAGTARAEPSSKIRIAAGVSTGLFAALMTVSGILYLVRPAFIAAALQPLGYPAYFLTLLGAAKLLGVAGLLAPRRPILREWAYAGFTFDLAAAVASHLVTDGIAHVPPVLFAFALLSASYVLRRRLAEGAGR